jgi:bifunctional non-homologous end joining protein LigD
MLASAGKIRGDASEYAFEPKWDGWRAMIYVGEQVMVRTRTGRDVTESVPELDGLVRALDGRNVLLDGELVAHRGTPSSFYRLSGRMAARRPDVVARAQQRAPITFVAFDILWNDGTDVTSCPYAERRRMLEDLELVGRAWCTTTSHVGDGAELFAACTALGLEGLVAKRLTSLYRPGIRSADWVKAKCADWTAGHAQHRHAKR